MKRSELKRIIKEEILRLMEGRYDKLTGDIVDVIWKYIKETKEIYDNDESRNVQATKILTISDKKTELNFGFQIIIDRTPLDRGFNYVGAEISPKKVIKILVKLDPEMEPQIYSKINPRLQDTVRHEIQHLLQSLKRKDMKNKLLKSVIPSQKEVEKINKDPLKYFTANYEVPAIVMGMYRGAKTEKKPIDIVMKNYLDFFINWGDITKSQEQKIMKIWIDYAKKELPKVQFKNG